jgi:serine/threonine-protein kinase
MASWRPGVSLGATILFVGELEPGGKVAGKYTLIGRVGRGGMGDVWIARNESTGAEVAIKTLRADRRRIEQAEERFRQEARVSAKLEHPNIARIYDLVEEADGTLLLVMERLRGETLKEAIAKGPLDSEKAIEIGLSILEALAAAHDAGIVHRDVTPANIFIAEEGGRHIPKLIDFGVAKAEGNTIETKAGHALGTPQYMSPEQIRSGVVDGRSDLFALSVTLFEAMTQTSPFKKANASGSLAAVLETEVDPDSRIPPAIWLALARGLSKQAYERPSDAREMASVLRRARGHAPPADPEPSPTSVASADLSGHIDVVPAAPKRPWGLVAAVGVLVVTLAVAAVTVLRREKPADGKPMPSPPPPATTAIAPPPTASSAPASASVAHSATPRPHPPSVTTKPQASAKTKPVATRPDF